MTTEDAKIYAINLGTMLVSLSQIETMLKILLLIASIGYTMSKWIEIYRKKNDNA
jgi:hypothetical protein